MSDSTRSTSIATRDSVITSPASMLSGDGWSGTSSSTNFSPNRVLGRIRAVVLAGMIEAFDGSIASERVAPSPLELISRTSPTMTPRIFTSASAGSWRPMLEVLRETGT